MNVKPGLKASGGETNNSTFVIKRLSDEQYWIAIPQPRRIAVFTNLDAQGTAQLDCAGKWIDDVRN